MFDTVRKAKSKPKNNEVVYVAGIRQFDKPFVIKSYVSASRYERFTIKMPTIANYHGFSGGLVTNESFEAIGVVDGQLGEDTSDFLFCQFITPDKYNN